MTSLRLSTRYEFLKEIYLRRGALVLLVIYNGLQFISNLLAWTTSQETQQRYQFIKVVQTWSSRTWVIGLLLILLGITVEGAYRFVRAREQSLTSLIENSDHILRALNEKLTPKLEIVYEPHFPCVFDDHPMGRYELRIGIKNVSSQELSRVKVQLDNVRYGTMQYHSLPLHVSRTKRLYDYPYQTEFSLNPGETEYLDLASRLKSNSWGSFSYSGGAPDHINEGKIFDFTITAMASEGEPLRRQAAISVSDPSPGFKFVLKHLCEVTT